MKKTTPEHLLPISELIASKEALMDAYMESLNVLDMLDDNRFNQLHEELKKAILPEPVVFGEAKIVTVGRKRSLPAMARRAGSKLQRIFNQVVKIPFTGSRELFRYAPESLPDCCSEEDIIKPVGNELSVTVHLPFVGNTEILQEATVMLGLTMQMVQANNAVIAKWTSSMERRLEEVLRQKRSDFMEIYGSRQDAVGSGQ